MNAPTEIGKDDTVFSLETIELERGGCSDSATGAMS